jgi:NAD+-dependent protein deacetylase sirtuin 4
LPWKESWEPFLDERTRRVRSAELAPEPSRLHPTQLEHSPEPEPTGLDLARWVPSEEGPWHSQAEELAERLRGKRLCVLTGAGISTESGIPDYRGGGTERRARNPIRFADFVKDPALQKRYWARSLVGYGRMSRAQPSRGHTALRELELAGKLCGLVTQNVDGLHHKAGSTATIELHGGMAHVVCLACGAREPRTRVQERMVEQNPLLVQTRAPLAPDGDADFPDDLLTNFRVPVCASCTGPIKPDVVFFGEAVPRARVEHALARLESCDALLVVGSSLAVFSGYRFPRRALELGRPVYLVNLGPTRADSNATLKVAGRASHVLPFVTELLITHDS